MVSSKPGAMRLHRRHGRGQALTEFALVIPIFLLVLSGVLDFGFMLFSRMSVINAAREGARAGAMTADPTTMVTAVKNRVVSAAASGGITVDPLNVTLACLQRTSSSWSESTNTPKCTWSLYNKNTNPSGAQPGDSVSVTINYSYKSFFPLLFGTSFNLSSTVQMVLDNVTTGT
jgi:Flp pilus assembly protein TadG